MSSAIPCGWKTPWRRIPLTLTGANTYTGPTVINEGRLKLENTYASSSFHVASGAILELNASSGERTYAATTFSGHPGTAQYDSLQTRVQRNFTGGYQVQFSYTWGHSVGYTAENSTSSPRVNHPG